MVVHGRSLFMECFVLLNPSTPDSLACQTVSSTIIIDFFQCPLAGQQFFNICEIFLFMINYSGLTLPIFHLFQ